MKEEVRADSKSGASDLPQNGEVKAGLSRACTGSLEAGVAGRLVASVDGTTTDFFAGVSQDQLTHMHRQMRREVYDAILAKSL